MNSTEDFFRCFQSFYIFRLMTSPIYKVLKHYIFEMIIDTEKEKCTQEDLAAIETP